MNLENENYEESAITYKVGKKLRGYKIGTLRGTTSNREIEEIVMSTSKDHDFEMSKKMIEETKYLKK